MTALQAEPAQLSRLHSDQTIYVAISPSELRQLFGQAEAEFYQSKLYHKVSGWLQHQLPGEDDLVSQVTGSLGKEAIRLALRQLVSSASQIRPSETAPGVTTARSSGAAAAAARSLHRDPQINSIGADPVATQPILSDQPNPFVLSSDSGLSLDPSRSPDEALSPNSPEGAAPGAIPGAIPDAIATVPGSENRKAAESDPWGHLEPAATLADVGLILQQVRQQAGLSLERLHQMTHVPKHHIQAIEAGASDRLPEEVYVKGFVRHLGNALGLDSAKLTCYSSCEPFPKPKAQADVKYPRPRTQSASRSSLTQLRPAHLYTGYATLMLGAVGSLCWVTWQQPVVNGDTALPPSDASADEAGGDRTVWMPVNIGDGIASKLRYFQLSKQQSRQLGEVESIAVPELILDQIQTIQALDSK